MIFMDVDIEYEFDLEPITNTDYQCNKHIVEWNFLWYNIDVEVYRKIKSNTT